MTSDRRTIDAIANLIDIADRASERSVTERVRAEKAEAELAAIRELMDRAAECGDGATAELVADVVAILDGSA